jgi:protein-disulfide isomerase
MNDHSSPPGRPVSVSWRDVFDVAATAIVAVAAVALLWNLWFAHRAAQHVPIADRDGVVSIDGVPARGNPTAKVAVLEYSDFQCPSCARAFYELLPQIQSDYVATGKVLFVFRHYPLQSIHPLAVVAAVAAECAARQNRFWPLHDRLYSHRGQLDAPSIRDDVVATGAEISEWDACISSPGALEAVNRERAPGKAIGIRGTPTFLIGRLRPDRRVRVVKEITGVSTLARWRSRRPGSRCCCEPTGSTSHAQRGALASDARS